MRTNEHTTPCESFYRRLGCLALCAFILALPACAPDDAKKANNTTGVAEGDSRETTDTDDVASADQENRLLRHAVFFKFREEATDEDVQGVVDAFRELPSKIDTIVDFKYGTNNSPEGKNDGITHCFLLTFKDEAGRAVYLPHDAHKAFGKVLDSHPEKIFVVDYWGTKSGVQLDKELIHMVFFKFKDDAAEEDIQKVVDAFAALPSKIDTIKAFEWGTNNSPEGKNDGFTHAFAVTFDSEEGRAAYLPHPEHQAFVKVLLPVLDKVRVIDFWAEK